jgi:acetyl-CoA carboxylase biotin carboxylase subunit
MARTEDVAMVPITRPDLGDEEIKAVSRVVRSQPGLPQSGAYNGTVLARLLVSVSRTASWKVWKYIESPRHIEIQVMADAKGNVVHLGERECSIQRRHQKLIEESPSPTVSERLRRRMGRTTVDAAAAVQYVNSGTIEFLLDSDGNYYFMEINTRIQVEDGVTELVTGVDLVKEQILVAAGERLSFGQSDVALRGHAIECRINAEDPVSFVPSPGVSATPTGLAAPACGSTPSRTTAARSRPTTTAWSRKLMVHGRDRREAIARMRRCLDAMVVEGLKSTIPLHRKVLADPDF